MKHIKAAQKAIASALFKIAEENVYSQITDIQLEWKSVLQNAQLSAAQKLEQGKELLATAAALEQTASLQTKGAVTKAMEHMKLDLRKIELLAKKEAQKPQTRG
jgi:hypothetical protein